MLMKEQEKIAGNAVKMQTSDRPGNSNLYHEPVFDFFSHVHLILQGKTNTGFLGYHELYQYLGQRFCFKKREIKLLLHTMQARDYLVLRKRGVALVTG